MALLGTFILANNTGSFDRMVMMKDMLAASINTITQQRQAQGYSGAEALPTISDIEQTHTIVPRNSFKPYVPVSSQYLKLTQSAGNLSWGGSITFDIQNMGEFIWDTFLQVVTNPLTATAGTNYSFPEPEVAYAEGQPLRVVNGQGQTIGSVTSAATPVWTPGVTTRNYVYFANNLAHALFTQHDFYVSSAPIDNYMQYTDTFYLNARIPQQKRAAYLRCIGQETPIQAYSQTVNFPADGSSSLVTNEYPSARQVITVTNGPQTPQYTQRGLNLIYPYKFDFCESPSNSIPILQIQGARREIKSYFSTADRVVFTQSPYILEQSVVLSGGDGTDEKPWAVQTYRYVVDITDSTVSTANFFNSANLYVNNIFIDSLIHDIYTNRVAFNLTRLHLNFETNITASNQKIQLNTFKWGLEYLFCGMRDAAMTPSGNVDKGYTPLTYAQNWDVYQFVKPAVYTQGQGFTAQVGATGGGGSDPQFARVSGGANYIYYYTQQIMQDLQFTLQTINLVQSQNGFPAVFYDSYTPFRMGGFQISGADKPGYFMVNFSFAPGAKNPYGYYNISRAREFYAEPNCPLISSGAISSATFVASGIALNFLYVAQGNLNVRFT